MMAGQTFNESRIDRSIGVLLLGLVVSGFFLLAILGMQSVQESAENLTDGLQETAVTKPVYDLAN